MFYTWGIFKLIYHLCNNSPLWFTITLADLSYIPTPLKGYTNKSGIHNFFGLIWTLDIFYFPWFDSHFNLWSYHLIKSSVEQTKYPLMTSIGDNVCICIWTDTFNFFVFGLGY